MPFVNKEFTIPTMACDYSLQQKKNKKDSNKGSYMDLDNECVLKHVRWLDATNPDDLCMSKMYRLLVKGIQESSITNKSSQLSRPRGVRVHNGEL